MIFVIIIKEIWHEFTGDNYPEPYTDVLVTIKGYEQVKAMYVDKNNVWWFTNIRGSSVSSVYQSTDILAWAPLIDIYKKE